jgi:Cof subfamily protein (haloacid dehalogenase superfamily)
MKRFRLMVADYDGTMVNDPRVMTSRMIADLEEVHRQGYLFGMASGRDWKQVLAYGEQWGLSFPFDMAIGMNGQQLYDCGKQKLTEYSMLKKGAISAILSMMAPLHVTVMIHYQGLVYVSQIDAEVEASIRRNHYEGVIRIIDNPDDFYDVELPKIMYRVPEERMPEVEEWVRQHPSPLYKGFRTQKVVYEFTDPTVDKGVALQDYCRDNGIPLDQVITFGDTTNDNGMLACSYGVCLANGTPDTKAVATVITELDNNHDGMADYLEKHILDRPAEH